MPRYTGINHLAMVTGDMDATIRFWRDLLKLPLIAGLGRPGYRQYFFAISKHDMIGFFEWDGITPIEEKDHGAPVTGSVAFDHVSLGVQDSDDLWEIRDALESAGHWVSEPVDHGFIHSIYAFDPNGIAIEFSMSVPNVDLRTHPRMTDPDPTAICMEGPQPTAGAWPEAVSTPVEERQLYPGEGHDFLHARTNKWDNS